MGQLNSRTCTAPATVVLLAGAHLLEPVVLLVLHVQPLCSAAG
jgi:hypothetical protein